MCQSIFQQITPKTEMAFQIFLFSLLFFLLILYFATWDFKLCIKKLNSDTMYFDPKATVEYRRYHLAQQYKKTHRHIRYATTSSVQHTYAHAQKDLKLNESS